VIQATLAAQHSVSGNEDWHTLVTVDLTPGVWHVMAPVCWHTQSTYTLGFRLRNATSGEVGGAGDERASSNVTGVTTIHAMFTLVANTTIQLQSKVNDLIGGGSVQIERTTTHYGQTPGTQVIAAEDIGDMQAILEEILAAVTRTFPAS
jgi:hypothetical protein